MSLPIDWTEWSKEWMEWKEAHSSHFSPVTPGQFPDNKNILADDILGRYKVNGQNVELSEVTFPNLEQRGTHGQLLDFRVRFIGITFSVDGKCKSGGVVSSFDELETVLGITA